MDKEEFTIIRSEEIYPKTSLADISFMIGETVTELLDRGAKNFQVSFEEDAIEVRCEKGFDAETLIKQNGYDAERKYKSLWRS